MREISPALNATVDEYLETLSFNTKTLIEDIRKQKAAGSRPRPSTSLVDLSLMLTPLHRATLLDKIAMLVDENLNGRADMCCCTLLGAFQRKTWQAIEKKKWGSVPR